MWLSAQREEAKTVVLAPNGFERNSFPHQSRSCGGGIATIYKSTLDSNIKFETNIDFAHTSHAGINYFTAQHINLFLFVPPCTKPTKQSY